MPVARSVASRVPAMVHVPKVGQVFRAHDRAWSDSQVRSMDGLLGKRCARLDLQSMQRGDLRLTGVAGQDHVVADNLAIANARTAGDADDGVTINNTRFA
jgi:hypothetical protein